METVKVDVQKLQILNDRLTQCLEALGQVRLSAHALQPSFGTPFSSGISHTNLPYGNQFGSQFGFNQPYNVWNQMSQLGYGQGISHTNPFTQGIGLQNPFVNQLPQTVGFGYGQPYNMWNQMSQLGYGGISHTSPWVQGSQQINPQISQLSQMTGGMPWINPTVNPFFGQGISHTSVLTDPYVAARVVQTFPFAFSHVPVW
jgi:hypothetical protein